MKYKLETTLFCSGAIVMIFEILGSRIYGPYFGTSTFVWTSLIGVILAFISLGYYIGGMWADKYASPLLLSKIIFYASIAMFFVFWIKDFILLMFQQSGLNFEVSTAMSSIIIFGPVSFLLGLVSPLAVKLKIETLSDSGKVVGKMYAIGTLGSIIGTFSAGFFLIPLFGTNQLLLSLCLSLVFLSFFVSRESMRISRIIFLIIVFTTQTWFYYGVHGAQADGKIDIDTKYSRIQVYDFEHRTGKQARVMQINTENHSSMFLDSTELTNEYTKYYHLASVFHPDFRHALMIGGAGYSFPKDYLEKYPNKTLDVLEIDPGVTELAKKYFKLVDHPRMNIYHRDAREYLNQTHTKYDVIFGDAFTSYYSIPYQLTTQEAIQQKYDILDQDGVVILNIISAINGDAGKFLRAEYATYKSVFPQVYIIPTSFDSTGMIPDNILLIALKSEKPFNFTHDYGSMQEYIDKVWKNPIAEDMPILRDNYAPVESYLSNMF